MKRDELLHEWKREVRQKFAGSRLEPAREMEIVDELAQHLDDRFRELLSSGTPRDKAVRAVIDEMNQSRLLSRELMRTERPAITEITGPEPSGRRRMFGDLWHDLRHGARRLRRTPGFTVIAILTLAVGIGANTAIFSIVNGVLLRELPCRDPKQLVWIWATRTDRDKAFYSIPNLSDTSERNSSFEQLAAFANWGVNFTGGGDPERWQGIRLSGTAFQMLGVEAVAGRALTGDDDNPQSARVVVLSHALWQRRFGGDPGVVGKTLLLNGDVYAVAGVLPSSFTIPNAETQVITSLRLDSDPRRNERGSNFLRVFGRLKRGVTADQARADLASVTSRLRDEYPDFNAKLTAPNVFPLQEEIVGGYQKSLLFLFGAVGMVLLIACANLANLLLARTTARQQEIAVRAALGATRWRLSRLLLVESTLLALIGGSLGVFLAASSLSLLPTLGPADLPRLSEIAMDGRILGFSLALSLFAGIAFGFAPALKATSSVFKDLKSGVRAAGRTSSRFRNALVVGEVAVSLMLLVGAGLLIRSFARLQSVSPGFDASGVMVARLSLPGAKYGKAEVVTALCDRLNERLSVLPGVESLAATTVLPVSGMNVRTDFSIVGRAPLSPSEMPAAQDRWVTPSYFRTMRIPISRGRDFNEFDRESGARVVVVDEALAERYWAAESPVGSHIAVDFGNGDKPRDFEVIGVCGNVKHVSLNETPSGTLYSPISQIPQSVIALRAANLNVVVRGSSGVQSLGDLVQREIRSVDSDVPASDLKTMDDLIAGSVAARRFNLLLLAVFAAAALILAAAGLYAVISNSVTQRTREIGIRIALGATIGDTLRLVIGNGMRLAIIGIAAGLAAAFALTRVMSAMLFGVSATDPATFIAVALLLFVVALMACWFPARRAASIDPLAALRDE